MHKAIECGFDYKGGGITLWQQTALRPDFWQALGKACGWEENIMSNYDLLSRPFGKQKNEPVPMSQFYALSFVYLILQGKPTDDFWQEILQSKT